MSGRLVILPKKTYCPWKPENIERVLRDERLERERLEKERKRSTDNDEDLRRPRGEERTTTRNDEGHINLFPEAKDAELNLLRGELKCAPPLPVDRIPDAPLGGDEAARRKS